MSASRVRRIVMWSVAWLLGAAVLAGAAWMASRHLAPAAGRAESPVALVGSPPADEAGRAVLQAWLDALAEEGFHVTRLQADDIERKGLPQGLRGVILPDAIAERLGDRTIAELHRHVREGGRLLVAFDAGMRTEDGAYSPLRSRLSDLAGVAYARYHEQRESIFHHDVVRITPAGLAALGVQPGKAEPTPAGDELKAYGYEHLVIPMLSTEPLYRGEVLARSARGDVVVGRSRYGHGEVLFLNAPVGYLKTRSDGYLLHQGLRLFMGGMLGQPQLLAVPGGVGGLVMNVHVDSGAAVQPLLALEDAGVFRDARPWSLHFTAGPDTYAVGDRAGLDLDHNAPARAFVLRMRALGHEIGSHGGWNHNVFGFGVNEHNRARFEPYLSLNANSLQQLTGEPQLAYSAPEGNQPLWVNRWLQAHGFLAYYGTGGSGLGPTRAWRDGQRADIALWAFPVATLGSVATFEEMDGFNEHDAADATKYRDFVSHLIDYAARERVARLAYFHAPAGALHLDVLRAWIACANRAQAEGRFRWYRMDELARFMTRRELASWSWRDGRLVAEHPQSLAGLTWLLRGVPPERLQVLHGQARIEAVADGVLVSATAGSTLVVGPASSSGDKAP